MLTGPDFQQNNVISTPSVPYQVMPKGFHDPLTGKSLWLHLSG
jgi:hypothetical protein